MIFLCWVFSTTVLVAGSMCSIVAVTRVVPVMVAWPGDVIVSTLVCGCAHAAGVIATRVAMSRKVLVLIEFSIESTCVLR
jgi:hypothetical protein